MFIHHKRIKLEMTNRKVSGKFLHIWKPAYDKATYMNEE